MDLDNVSLDEIRKRLWTEGVDLKTILSRSTEKVGMIDAMPRQNRLAYVESLVKERGISFGKARDMLQANPILPDESRQLFTEIGSYLSSEFGMATDYGIEFLESRIMCHTNADKKTILIPEKLGIEAPFTISFAQAQAFQCENSSLVRELRASKSKSTTWQIRGLLEGFPGFITLSYCRARDEKVGRGFYSTDVLDIYSFGRLENVAKGIDYFAGIMAGEGPSGVTEAIRNFRTDQELASHSDAVLRQAIERSGA